MSGSGGGGGYKYQADAFAFVAAHALAEQPLNWFGDIEDIPVAVSMETGGPGDDIGVELRAGGRIEVQCKHGAKKDQIFVDAFLKAAQGLNASPTLRAVLMTDGSSSGSITGDLRSDVIRLGMGRADNLKNITTELINILKQHGVTPDAGLFSRLRIVIKDLEEGMDGQVAAASLLARVVESSSQSTTAWRILSSEGQELTAKRGRRDLRSLVNILSKNVALSPTINSYALAAERYRRWVLASNETFLIPGLNIRLPVMEAWGKLIIDKLEKPPQEPETLARQISRYHEWERLAEDARRDSEVCDAESAMIGKERLVISGGPGAGKSTLARRLTVWAANKDALVLRASLKRVARLLRDGIPFEFALLQVALDGSGISEDVGRAALASPDYLVADGLDECDPDRAEVANHLISWATGHRGCHVCVLTRPVGHTPSLLPGFSRAELLPLDDTAIEGYSEKFIAARESDSARRAALASEFRRLVVVNKEERRVASLAARNPLLLSFLSALFLEGKPLTNRRAGLFEQIVDLIRRSPMSDRATTADVHEVVAGRVIEVTAWHLIGTPDIDLKTLLNEVARDITAQAGTPPLEARRLANEGLKFCEERRLIERLTLGHSETYTFVHLSLGEYLAGRYISQMGDESLRSWLSIARGEARWRQPILLASGANATARIVSLLLEFDAPQDPVSTEAVLAAFAVTEAAHVDPETAERVISSLHQRLTSKVPLVAIEAGDGLRYLAPHAPDLVGKITEGLLDHEQKWTRFAAFAARVTAGLNLVTLEQAQKLCRELRPVATLHFRTQAAESRIDELPKQAFELQEYLLANVLERMFAEADADKSRSLVSACLEHLRHNISVRTLQKISPILYRHGAGDIVVKALELDKHKFDLSAFLTPAGEKGSPDVALLEAIFSAARPDNTSEEAYNEIEDTGSPESDFINLSIFLSGIDFWEADYQALSILTERRDDAPLREVFRGAIIALGLNREQLAKEAKLAIQKLPETKHGFIIDLIRKIPVTPNWGLAKDENLSTSAIVEGLSHRVLMVVIAAANLLEAGVGGEEARQLILRALQSGSEVSLRVIASISPRIWGENEAAKILLRRVSGSPVAGFDYIYKVLAELAPAVETPVRAEINEAILSGIFSADPATATGASEALLELALVDEPNLRERVREAFDHWTERGSWCERCSLEVHTSSCSNCRHVPPNPRVALLKVLAGLGEFTTDELLRLCEDEGHEVPDAAYKALTERAGEDSGLLKSLLHRIKDGLAPFKSSTALNLLYSLLKLPARALKTAEPDILALTAAGIPAIRNAVISSLTAEWVSNESALKLAQTALDDEHPGVRNSAVEALRLLRSRTAEKKNFTQ